nr:E3 ubiquitin-protein ligase SDIR1-like [Ipomoea batatas]
MSFVFRGTRGDIETGFPGLIPERRTVRVHAARPVNSNSLAFLVTVLLLFMILNSHQLSPNFLLWLVLGVFLMATTLRMYATCQQLQAQAQAHAVAASGLLGHTELRLHMPPSIALATRGRLQGLRLQLALLDREFDDLDYETLRALDADNVPTTPSMTEEEINALPIHKYKKKQEPPVNSTAVAKPTEDELTCSVCLEQVNEGELIRSLPCLHQFHANCIDPWLRQQGTCPVPDSQSRRTNSLLRRNIWWRTCTTIGIFWFAGDYSYLPNLNEETKEESSALRKLINRHESNFTFMVLSATSQALMTDPLPTSNVNTVLSSRVVSNTSPVSARVPS